MTPIEGWRSLDRNDLNYATSYLRTRGDAAGRAPVTVLGARGCVDFVGRWARAVAVAGTAAPASYRGRVVAVVGSRNQRRVVDALSSSEGDAEGHPRALAVVTKSIGTRERFPLAWAYVAASRHLVEFATDMRRQGPELRRVWATHISEYALTTGLYVAARRWLAAAGPAAVLVSNDHEMRSRVFVEAARHEGIPTVYVQHASVTPRFPPLRTDVALLDGVAAAAAYLTAGPSNSRVFLTGSPLHDRLLRVPVEGRRNPRLGLCLNLLDDPGVVTQIVSALAEAPALPIEIRTHPRDERPWRAWLAHLDVTSIRSARDEQIEEFLARVSVVVAGDSNVHLEAALAGVPSVYAAQLGTGRDDYAFVRAGLARAAVTHAELRDAIVNTEPASRDACRRFDATVGTAWAGRAGSLIKSVLGDVVRGASEPPTVFSHVATIEGVTVHAIEAEDLVALGALQVGRGA